MRRIFARGAGRLWVRSRWAAGVVQVRNGVGADEEQVVASEASEKYKFINLLSWWVISMQTMNKDA